MGRSRGGKLLSVFRSILDEVLGKVDGALSVTLMGTDGIPIDEVRAAGSGQSGMNLDLIAAEYAALQKRVAKTNQGLEMSEVKELQIVTDSLVVLLSMVGPEYFLLLLMKAATGIGRARYELLRARLRLEAELA